jgi:hypothetical protein
MEAQSFELMIEDILLMHRQWITKLYIEDCKTEMEIVCILHRRRLLATCEFIMILITTHAANATVVYRRSMTALSTGR